MLYFISSLRTSLFFLVLFYFHLIFRFSHHFACFTKFYLYFFVLHFIEINSSLFFLYFSAAIVVDTRLNKAKKCLLWNIFSVVKKGIFEAFFVLLLLLLNIVTHRKGKYSWDSLLLCSHYIFKKCIFSKVFFHYLIHSTFCRVMAHTKTSLLIVLCYVMLAVCWSA